jgi:hypothetical protein
MLTKKYLVFECFNHYTAKQFTCFFVQNSQLFYQSYFVNAAYLVYSQLPGPSFKTTVNPGWVISDGAGKRNECHYI